MKPKTPRKRTKTGKTKAAGRRTKPPAAKAAKRQTSKKVASQRAGAASAKPKKVAGKRAKATSAKPKKATKAKKTATKRKPRAADAVPELPPAQDQNAPRARTLKERGRKRPVHVVPKRLASGHKPVKKVAPGARDRQATRPKGGKRTPLKVAGHKVEKGTSENILLKVSEHYTHQGVYIPVTIIRGARNGPRLFLTAAVHGDEINGVQIIRETIDRIDPKDLRGTVVAVPVVNRFGFVSHSRYMPDRRDLNRYFPGEPHGNTTSRLAHVVFEEIIRLCDFGIDLHTAGYQRHNLPQIRGDMSNDDVRRIAKSFGAEVILDTKGHKGTLRRAATEAGVPTLIYEAGETFRFQRDVITKGVTGILNVMRELKMLKGKIDRPPYQVIVKTSQWVRADHGGIMEVLVEAGDLVFAGEEIAHIANPFGRTVDSVRAPFDGIVVGVTMLPMVNPGAPVCHLVKLKKTLATVAHHHGRVRVDRIEQEDIDEEPPLHALEEEDVEG